jgi:hypothetical protein
MISKHLFHYAMVQKKYAETGDLLAGLVPLFTPLFEGHAEEEFNPEVLGKKVKEAYGIEMHPYVAEGFSQKLVDANVLTRIDDARSGRNKNRYLINSVDASGDSQIRDKVERLVKRFEHFCIRVLSIRNLDLTGVDYSYEFSRRLSRSDLILDSKANDDDDGLASNLEIKKGIDYCFARMIEYIRNVGGEPLDTLEKAYSGAVFSEVVLSIREPDFGSESVKDKKFYIDAPILLNILGFNDKFSVESSRRIVSELIANGAVVTTTTEYISEARNSICAALENLKHRGSRSTSLDFYLFNNPNEVSEVRIVLPRILETLNEHYNFSIDHAISDIAKKITSRRAVSLREKMVGVLSWYNNETARQNDADALTFVVADHGYSAVKNMSQSKSFLVSMNQSMIDSALHVLYSLDGYTKSDVTPLISEKKLAVMLWVLGGNVGEKIPSENLLASCLRVTEVHKEVFRNIKTFLIGVSEDKAKLYEEVLRDDRLLGCLMDAAGGDFDQLTSDNIEGYINLARTESLDFAEREREANASLIDVARRDLENEKAAKQKVLDNFNSQTKIKEETDAQNRRLEQEIALSKKKIEESDRELLSEQKDKNIVQDELYSLKRELERQKEIGAGEIEILKSQLERSQSLDKYRIENQRKGIRFILKFAFSVFMVYVLYNLQVVPVKDYDIGYFVIKSASIGSLNWVITLAPLLMTWKVPDFLFGKFINSISDRIITFLWGEDVSPE